MSWDNTSNPSGYLRKLSQDTALGNPMDTSKDVLPLVKVISRRLGTLGIYMKAIYAMTAAQFQISEDKPYSEWIPDEMRDAFGGNSQGKKFLQRIETAFQDLDIGMSQVAQQRRLASDSTTSDSITRVAYKYLMNQINRPSASRVASLYMERQALYFGEKDMVVGEYYKGTHMGKIWYFKPTAPMSKSGKIKGALLYEGNKKATLAFIGKKTNYDGIKWEKPPAIDKDAQAKLDKKA